MNPVRQISDAEVASVMTTSDFVDSCDQAFRLYGLGEMKNPVREETVLREGELDLFRLVLPGEWIGKFRGQKVIEERSDVLTGRLGDRTAVIELVDLQSGLQAVVDAEFITNMRTGAAGALGAKYLAQTPVECVAILGTGRIAQALARCVDVVLAPTVMKVTSRTQEKREAFVADIGGEISCELMMTDNVEACIDGADAIFTSVPTPNPILTQIPYCAHVSVMGGDGRTTQLAPELLKDRPVVPDHHRQVLKSGEFVALNNANQEPKWIKNHRNEVLTVADAVLGHMENLRGKGAIVYFSGMAIQDVHAAAVAWGKLS